jgi:uncharacterized protein DUF1236
MKVNPKASRQSARGINPSPRNRHPRSSRKPRKVNRRRTDPSPPSSVVEDETIYIVDPRTYVVVDEIHAGTQHADRPGRAQLSLSPEQMRFIHSSVPRDRNADVRVRLALGAEVPRNVQLLTFPGDIVARIPEVESFRYIVADDDVVVVDPVERGVVLVINEGS